MYDANDAAGRTRRTEHLIAFVLPRQVYGGLHHILRLLRCIDGDNHHQSGKDEINGRRHRARRQRGHQKVSRCGSIGIRHIVVIRVKSGEWHADKVHKVVTRKRHGEGKRTNKYHDLEDIHPKSIENLHHYSRDGKRSHNQHLHISVYPLPRIVRDIGRLAQPFQQDEVGQYSEGNTAEHARGIARMTFVIECEDYARQPHYDDAEEEGDSHRHEDGDNHAQCLVGVEQVGKRKRRVGKDLHRSEHKRTAEQLEHK